MSQARKKPSRHCWAGEPFESMWYIVVWECMGFDFIFSPSDDRVPQTRVRGAFYCGEFEGESLPFSFGFCFFGATSQQSHVNLVSWRQQGKQSKASQVRCSQPGQEAHKRTQSGHKADIVST